MLRFVGVVLGLITALALHKWVLQVPSVQEFCLQWERKATIASGGGGVSRPRGALLESDLPNRLNEYLPLAVTASAVEAVALDHVKLLTAAGFDFDNQLVLSTPAGLNVLHQVLQTCGRSSVAQAFVVVL